MEINMKTLEMRRVMDGFEKRLSDLTKEYNAFKEKINGKEKEPIEEAESKKVDVSKKNTKKFKDKE
jgi:hypothetical protein